MASHAPHTVAPTARGAGTRRSGAAVARASGQDQLKPSLPVFLHDGGAANVAASHLPHELRRGRGAAATALSQRFEALHTVLDADLFDFGDADENDVFIENLKTQVAYETPRHVISKNNSPDIPFDRSINAYRGCEHGCVYCFARPTHAYLGLSPALDFETKLTAKQNVAEILRKELSRPGYVPAPIAMGTNTDPYQPIERSYETTRQILQVLEEFGHPCTIVTKNHLVTRDIDILARMARRNLVKVSLSVTTLDARLARAMEPRASTPSKRLDAIAALSAAGIPVGVMVAPVIPGLTDHEIERILDAAQEAGAQTAAMIPLRLPHEVKDIFKTWLQERVPDRAERVMNHVRGMRGGKENNPEFFERFKANGVFGELMLARFRAACTRLGLNRQRTHLSCDDFFVPGSKQQLSLFAA